LARQLYAAGWRGSAGTALIVGGLSYLPALAMGPIVEQLLLGR